MRVVHLITGLGVGGAERILERIVEAAPADVESVVVSLTEFGEIGRRVAARGVPVYVFSLRGWRAAIKLCALTAFLRRVKPDVVQTWLYKGDVVGGIAARVAGCKVIWGVHHADFHPAWNSWSNRLAARVAAGLSGSVPTAIVCCASVVVDAHAAIGYARMKMRVIENGIDAQTFSPTNRAVDAIRAELNIAKRSTRIVLFPARYHATKGHDMFAAAAALCAKVDPDVHFVLCGRDITRDNHALARLLAAHGIADRCSLLGERTDLPCLLASVDAVVFCSKSEALPLTVAEAMASGALVCATDVGDSRHLVGDAGFVTPCEPEHMATAWSNALNLLEEERARLVQAARSRVIEHFSEHRMTERYYALYREVARVS